jgi:predicted MFS family arabinose efflux permease
MSSVAAKSPAETKTRLPFVVVLLAVGTPTISVATMRLPKRLTLVLSLALFAVGHIVAALSPAFEIVLVARGITALAVSAFNVSIAAATWLAGVALDSSLGATGPSAVGAAMAIPGTSASPEGTSLDERRQARLRRLTTPRNDGRNTK